MSGWISFERRRCQARLRPSSGLHKKDFPGIQFPLLARRQEKPLLKGEKIRDINWVESPLQGEQLEKLMGGQPTFLPISFFESGLIMANSVVRIITHKGLGSGFLTSNNLLITNHHVIDNQETASTAVIQFNYQTTIHGLATESAEFGLAPEQGFATSPLKNGNDWTAVRVKDNPAARWGEISLSSAKVNPNDYVNIIQHPNGLPKQVAIYHNVVTHSDDRRVQYLTDTLPGSSGSPVFNSQWQIVALHHSYGWITERSTKATLFRNEGIAINALIDGLRENGLYTDNKN